MIRLVEGRWLTLQDVLLRIMEQYDNRTEYFLNTVTTQQGFKSKCEVGNDERNIPIKKMFTNKVLPAITSPVVVHCAIVHIIFFIFAV